MWDVEGLPWRYMSSATYEPHILRKLCVPVLRTISRCAPEHVRLVLDVEEIDGLAKCGRRSGDDGLPCAEKQRRIDAEEADRVDRDRCPGEQLDVLMPGAVASDLDARLEPLTFRERVAGAAATQESTKEVSELLHSFAKQPQAESEGYASDL